MLSGVLLSALFNTVDLEKSEIKLSGKQFNFEPQNSHTGVLNSVFHASHDSKTRYGSRETR